MTVIRQTVLSLAIKVEIGRMVYMAMQRRARAVAVGAIE